MGLTAPPDRSVPGQVKLHTCIRALRAQMLGRINHRIISWRIATAFSAVALSACVSLSEDFATANGITAAHATLVSSIGPFSLVRTSSFAVLDADAEPRFSGRGAHASPHHPTIEVVASDRLIQSGFDDSHALELIEAISRSLQHLERYMMRPVPVRRVTVTVAAPDELIRMHATSFSFSGQHTFHLAFRFSTTATASSNRRVVRTLSHELFHAAVGTHGRRWSASKALEERAAHALEDCIEMDTFGSILATAPGSLLSKGQVSTLPSTREPQSHMDSSLNHLCRTHIEQVAKWISSKPARQ